MADPTVSSLEGTTTALRGIRRTIARRMQQAWTVPVFHIGREMDMSRLMGPGRLAGVSVTDGIVAACAAALRLHPALNAHMAEDAVTVFERVNVGVAVATDAGLMVPVIGDADTLPIDALSARRKELTEKARSGTLIMQDVDGGTFTVSSLGMFGIDRFDAILNVPQVAILAVGTVRDRYIRTDDGGRWCPVADFTLTCDHSAIDGSGAAAFLATTARLVGAGEV